MSTPPNSAVYATYKNTPSSIADRNGENGEVIL